MSNRRRRDLPIACPDVELVAHRVANLLGLPLRTATPTTIELVGPVDAATRDRLAGWFNHQDATG